MQILEISEGKGEICRRILEALPDWFGILDAREAYIRAAQTQSMLVCRVGSENVGMLTLTQHSDWNLEIAIMGVLPTHQRLGFGTALIEAASTVARNNGIKLLSVKTLSDASPDPRYEMTRAFYRDMGFELFEVFPDLWDAHNPCALYVLPVATHA